jgi:hypothetical protein
MSREDVKVVRSAINLFEYGKPSSIFAQGLATPDAALRLSLRSAALEPTWVSTA